jgi:ribosome biogenesis GTPase
MPPASLEDLGWDAARQEEWEQAKAPGQVPGRVTVEHRGQHRVWVDGGEIRARFGRRPLEDGGSRPVVGDWVAVVPSDSGDARIARVMPRRTALSRRAAGDRDVEQPLAANVDVAFVVAGLDGDFNPRRVERALVLVWESGARPVILLNKSDAFPEVVDRVREMEEVAAGVPVHAISAKTGDGVEVVRGALGRGVTAVLLGSSGAGKSTLANQLLGFERQATREVREDDSRGRHTTTHRELVVLPEGGILIDTPGLRELQLWASTESLDTAFTEVADLSAACRFTDCQHEGEPGCAVRAAVADGRLPEDRLASYQKLKAELRHLETRVDVQAALDQKRKWRSIHRLAKRHKPRE